MYLTWNRLGCVLLWIVSACAFLCTLTVARMVEWCLTPEERDRERSADAGRSRRGSSNDRSKSRPEEDMAK